MKSKGEKIMKVKSFLEILMILLNREKGLGMIFLEDIMEWLPVIKLLSKDECALSPIQWNTIKAFERPTNNRRTQKELLTDQPTDQPTDTNEDLDRPTDGQTDKNKKASGWQAPLGSGKYEVQRGEDYES